MEEKYYEISESDLRNLLSDSARLVVLDMDGVDNWTWYMNSAQDFFSEVGITGEDRDFNQVADIWLRDYEQIV